MEILCLWPNQIVPSDSRGLTYIWRTCSPTRQGFLIPVSRFYCEMNENSIKYFGAKNSIILPFILKLRYIIWWSPSRNEVPNGVLLHMEFSVWSWSKFSPEWPVQRQRRRFVAFAIASSSAYRWTFDVLVSLDLWLVISIACPDWVRGHRMVYLRIQ